MKAHRTRLIRHKNRIRLLREAQTRPLVQAKIRHRKAVLKTKHLMASLCNCQMETSPQTSLLQKEINPLGLLKQTCAALALYAMT